MTNQEEEINGIIRTPTPKTTTDKLSKVAIPMSTIKITEIG